MRRRKILELASVAPLLGAGFAPAGVFNVRSFGAVGDGRTLDSGAINRAILAAGAAGGGTVLVPAGTYACHSLRLQSRIVLYLAPGATLLAAPPGAPAGAGYDKPMSNEKWAAYQDFGHNHWRDSLIWGEDIHDVAILGPGLIWGKGLSRGEAPESGLPPADAPGAGDKAIALKNCHDITLRDFKILAGGHIGFLATGVDDLTVDNLTIDTNRDGMNIDCCRNVRITGCRVSSPWDDGICLKSSFALGRARATENVTISDCYVTGLLQLGSMLDGGFRRFAREADDNGGNPTGRIKCGTESVGGFKDITIDNCVFEGCRDFALECVDGGMTEDITVTGIVMRDIRNAPFFLRLGARMRAPPGTPVGVLRRVIISDVICDAPANTMPALIMGAPEYPVEDIVLSNIRMVQGGGGTAAMATIMPPEQTHEYPEPSNFGTFPAQGLFVRHARNIEIRDVGIESRAADVRPFVWLGDVDGAGVTGLRVPRAVSAPVFLLDGVRNFRVSASNKVPDAALATVAHASLP